MKSYNVKKLMVDDENAFYELIDSGFLSSEYEDDLTINAKTISDKFSEVKQWETECRNEKQKVQELQDKIKDLESQSKNSSVLDQEIDQLKQRENEVLTHNEKLQSDLRYQKDKIQELEKQVNDLSFVRGICDKFGTYKSLLKDIEIVNYFRRNAEGKSVRWKELDKYFKGQGWAESTVLNHLKKLYNYGILKGREGFKGEYRLDLDSSEYDDFTSDIDRLIGVIMGRELYDLFMENLKK